METTLAIFAVVIGWISEVWGDFSAWFDKPATNGIVIIVGWILYLTIKSQLRAMELRTRSYERG
jgi:hypothetical protein